MSSIRRVKDSRGRVWTLAKVTWAEADAADDLYWKSLSGNERVVAVYSALESCLKTRGINAVPRFRRVHRIVKCPWSAASDRRRSRIR